MPDLALFYDHEPWLAPLKQALDRRNINWTAIDVAGHSFDPADPQPPAPLIFNRIAMSSVKREVDHPIFYADALFGAWERAGARVLNGGTAFAIDHNKARQLELIARAGHQAPRTRIIRRRADLTAAAEAIGFPLLVKANIGGAGAGIARYADAAALEAAMAADAVPDSIDKVWLVQDDVPARGGHIIRFEFLGDEFLYAIAVDGGGGFDLCPADACLVEDGKPPVTMTSYAPTEAMIASARDIMVAAEIDVGGCEAMIDDRDSALRFYDVNAFSNFAANAEELLGWDPHARLADHLANLVAEQR